MAAWHEMPCDGIFLAGGSIYGLDAAAGVRRLIEEKFRPSRPGAPSRDPTRVVRGIVSGAVIFDMSIGSSEVRPDATMGYAAAANASDAPVLQGNVGVGCGATIGKILGPQHAMKGGVGSVCLESHLGFHVGALVVVNTLGNVFDLEQGGTIAGAQHLDGAGFLEFAEVTQKGLPVDAQPGQHTTLCVVVTDVALSHGLLTKMAQAGQDGLARAVQPAHTSFDGDTFFAVTTAQKTLPTKTSLFSPDAVIHLASEAIRLAILRAVRTARSVGNTPGLME